MAHRTLEELAAGIGSIRSAPADRGVVDMIAARPGPRDRTELETADVTIEDGLVGDNWRVRGSRHTADGSADPGRQLTLMNSAAIALIAGDRDRWALAGDQLYVSLDLSEANLPAGTRLTVGEAVIEISPLPHTGCAKFIERYGRDAGRFVNLPESRRLRVRGLNAVVLQSGTIRRGDEIAKLSVSATTG